MKKILSISLLSAIITSCAVFASADQMSNQDIKNQMAIQYNIKASDIKITNRRNDNYNSYFTAHVKNKKMTCTATMSTGVSGLAKVGSVDCGKNQCNALLKANGDC